MQHPLSRKNPSLQTSPSYFMLAAARRLDANNIIHSPRERDVLNALQQHQNLFKSNAILDLSQSLGRNACRSDGLVPALGTGCSRLYAPAFGVFLVARQCLALQGHDTSKVPSRAWQHLSDDDVRTLAGNAMCVPVVGAIMAGCLALLRVP